MFNVRRKAKEGVRQEAKNVLLMAMALHRGGRAAEADALLQKQRPEVKDAMEIMLAHARGRILPDEESSRGTLVAGLETGH